MHNQIASLANYFVFSIVEANNSQEDRFNNAYYEISDLISKGWGLEELKLVLDNYKSQNPTKVKSIYFVNEITSQYKRKENLLNQDQRYYHNALIETDRAIRIVRSSDGSFKKIKTPFSGVSYVKVFTSDDLLDYYYKKMKIDPNRLNIQEIKRDNGKINYLLKLYDVEEILFSIDIAYKTLTYLNQPLMKDIFLLENYLEDGRKERRKKRNLYKQLKIKEKKDE